ncbi:hypothetical protein KCP71_02670 [Salmonella enterica subsp. enterica]|nr:hypothetical protein KCP71_02670 [Salmonella enterica subsp. enterica]
MTLIEGSRSPDRRTAGRQLGLEEELAEGLERGLERSACCRIAYRQTNAGGRTLTADCPAVHRPYG